MTTTGPGLAALGDTTAGLARVAGEDRATRLVAATRALVDMAGRHAIGLDDAEGLVAALVGMVERTEAAINALAAQRSALLAIATAVVDARPGTMVPLLRGEPVTAVDRDHARRALVADVAAATGGSEASTATLAHTAEELVANLPATFTAMAAGVLGDRHVRNVVRHGEDLSGESAARYEADVLGRLGADRSPAGVGRTARAARERCHPRTPAERHERAWRDRAVSIESAADGMAWLTAYLPAVQAGAIHDKLTGVARALGAVEGEKRTLAQRRADALTALVLDPPSDIDGVAALAEAAGSGALPGLDDSTNPSVVVPGAAGAASGPAASGAAGAEPGWVARGAAGGEPAPVVLGPVGAEPGPMALGAAGAGSDPPDGPDGAPPWALDPALHTLRPTVAVTVPVLTLLGASEEPGHMDGYGPIDPDTARVLAANAPSFIRVLTHPESGAVLSVGRERYAVPADLRTWLRIRDEVCRFPGCHRRAARAEIDHTVPFREGGHRGSTAAHNLAHLCASHHRLKHRTRWSVVQHGDGLLTWTSPTGRAHTTTPAVQIGSVADQTVAGAPDGRAEGAGGGGAATAVDGRAEGAGGAGAVTAADRRAEGDGGAASAAGRGQAAAGDVLDPGAEMGDG